MTEHSRHNNRRREQQRAFWRGLAFWALVACLGIALRGVRWEETLERAQALLGTVPYPEGHPLYQYARGAFGFHYWLSAALLWLTERPHWICAYRDVLSALAAVLPVYLLGAICTRSTRYAHAAVLLFLAGVQVFFRSYYTHVIWPEMFTSGILGEGYAFLVLALFCLGRWRTGFGLLGLMPIVHLGQMPVILAVGGAAGCILAYRRVPGWHASLGWFVAGLAASAVFWCVTRSLAAPVPTGGAYFSSAEPLDAWRRFTYFEDIHRRPVTPPRFGDFANSVMALLALLLISVPLAWEEWRGVPRRWGRLFFGYAVFASVAVVLAKGGQAFLGLHTPYLLIGWLPYRMPNHCAVLLLPALAGILARRGRSSAVLFVLAFAWLIAGVLAQTFPPASLAARYLAPSEGVLFFLTGAAMHALWNRPRMGALRLPWRICVLGAWLWLATEHQFGAALVMAGAAAGWTTARIPARWPVQRLRCVSYGTGVALLLTLLTGLAPHRQHFEISPFEREVAAVLQQEHRPDALLLTPHWQLHWQEKTGHPVFMTFETPNFLTYMRRLAPVIEQMMSDAYDIRYGESWNYELEAWRVRTREEWHRLGVKYGIGYVVSPNIVPLDLPPLLVGQGQTLYRVE